MHFTLVVGEIHLHAPILRILGAGRIKPSFGTWLGLLARKPSVTRFTRLGWGISARLQQYFTPREQLNALC